MVSIISTNQTLETIVASRGFSDPWMCSKYERVQDKQMIHDLVIEQEQSFQHINRVLKNCIGEALVECENSVNKQFEEPWQSLGISFSV